MMMVMVVPRTLLVTTAGVSPLAVIVSPILRLAEIAVEDLAVPCLAEVHRDKTKIAAVLQRMVRRKLHYYVVQAFILRV